MFEVEVKFALADDGAVCDLRAKLTAMDIKSTGTDRQVDQYFAHPCRDFGQTDEALRLRTSGGRTFITYKGPKIDRQTKTRRELELPLTQDADTFGELLMALGFTVAGTVRKTRESGTVAWQGREVHIALDRVHGLGAFVELELSADTEQLNASRTSLMELAAKLRLRDSQTKSYLELQLERSA